MVTKLRVAVFTICVLAIGGAASATPVAGQEAAASVTFHKDVLPILQKNCQICHRPGQIGPMPLLSYKDARPWAKAIKNAVVLRRMPPWHASPEYGHFLNDRSLKQSEIETLVAWADSGAQEGDAKDAPVPIQWPSDGWNIQPDVAVDLPAYSVPAHGVLEWERLAIPSPFKEDTWVTSIELLPGDPSVVHHICFDIEKHRPTTVYNRYEWMEVPRDQAGVSTLSKEEASRRREGFILTREVGSSEVRRTWGSPSIGAGGGQSFCYVPGLSYEDYRVWDAGRLVPAGSDIILTIHYNTNGKDAVDRSKIGFTVAKVAPPKEFLELGRGEVNPDERVAASGAKRLAIPPNEGNYLAPVEVTTFLKDVDLVWFWVHAHLRGKSARFTLIHPDGREEILLDVPRYDFNWQHAYRTRLRIPKGSRIRAEMWYDNSANNRSNPNPSTWVYEGDQTWEEMKGLRMGVLLDRDADPNGFIRTGNAK